MSGSLSSDIQLKKYFIAYFDILGYIDYVNSSSDNELYLAKTLRKTIDFINFRDEQAKQLDNEYKYKFRCFSDNFILCSEKYDQSLIEDIAWLQFNLALDNIFVRGSFSYGELHIDRDFIFGKGIINAYKIESSVAIFPRVVIDNTYTIKTCFPDDDIASEAKLTTLKYFGFIKTDFDGIHFIDYLDVAKLKSDIGHWKFEDGFRAELENHKKNIVNNIAEHSKQNKSAILQKYMWLKNYHNSFCMKHGFCDIVVQ